MISSVIQKMMNVMAMELGMSLQRADTGRLSLQWGSMG